MKMAESSILIIDFGRFETYKFVELWSPFAFKRELNDSYQGLAMIYMFFWKHYPGKTNFVSQGVEATDTLLRITDIEVFDKTEAVKT